MNTQAITPNCFQRYQKPILATSAIITAVAAFALGYFALQGSTFLIMPGIPLAIATATGSALFLTALFQKTIHQNATIPADWIVVPPPEKPVSKAVINLNNNLEALFTKEKELYTPLVRLYEQAYKYKKDHDEARLDKMAAHMETYKAKLTNAFKNDAFLIDMGIDSAFYLDEDEITSWKSALEANEEKIGTSYHTGNKTGADVCTLLKTLANNQLNDLIDQWWTKAGIDQNECFDTNIQNAKLLTGYNNLDEAEQLQLEKMLCTLSEKRINADLCNKWHSIARNITHKTPAVEDIHSATRLTGPSALCDRFVANDPKFEAKIKNPLGPTPLKIVDHLQVEMYRSLFVLLACAFHRKTPFHPVIKKVVEDRRIDASDCYKLADSLKVVVDEKLA